MIEAKAETVGATLPAEWERNEPIIVSASATIKVYGAGEHPIELAAGENATFEPVFKFERRKRKRVRVLDTWKRVG